MAYWTVTKVEPSDGYTLVLTFADGKRKRFDMSPYLDKGVFRQLRDERIFRSVGVAFGSVAWPNGADFDPCALYELGLPLDE